MKTACLSSYLVILSVALVSTAAFAPKPAVSHTFAGRVKSKTLPFQMGFMGDEDPKKLTRENEPDDYFRT
jgi:hypothetical protein